MKVEVLQARAPLGHKRVGDIIEDMPSGMASDLARRGIVRRVGRQAQAPVNRMVDGRKYARKDRG